MDIEIPFFRLVLILIKLSLAAIPAWIIVVCVWHIIVLSILLMDGAMLFLETR